MIRIFRNQELTKSLKRKGKTTNTEVRKEDK
jgi:hypothetical protein